MDTAVPGTASSYDWPTDVLAGLEIEPKRLAIRAMYTAVVDGIEMEVFLPLSFGADHGVCATWASADSLPIWIEFDSQFEVDSLSLYQASLTDDFQERHADTRVIRLNQGGILTHTRRIKTSLKPACGLHEFRITAYFVVSEPSAVANFYCFVGNGEDECPGVE
jgi:hypothetical protein